MIDLTNGLDFKQHITEGITFGHFNSIEEKLWLVDRPSSSFAEKENKEALPYVQGDIDFSMITGERILGNRTESYVFHMYEITRRNSGVLQMYLENLLFKQGYTKLKDTANPYLYFKGKCSRVQVDDDHQYKRFVVTIDFDCYPYMVSELPEGHGIWDKQLIPLDVIQQTEFTVNNNEEILLINPGSVSVVPKIITNNNFNVQNDEVNLSVTSGVTENEDFRLWPGENHISISGNGTIKFEFYRELI